MKYKKVLVTGSSGFIGSHLADALRESGSKVVLFDAIPSKYKIEGQKEFIGDILSLSDINEAMKDCNAVYHFAAQADIDQSGSDPGKTIKSNIIGTQNILDAARKNNIDRVLFASTIYVYSELGSFYRVSKQACEKIIEEYQKQFDLNYTILRYGSIYGPRGNEFSSIRNMLLQALEKRKIVRRGDGEEIREFIHVKDAAQLSVDALGDKYKNKHLIITGNQQIKIKDLLIMIKEIFENKIEIEYNDDVELHHYEITPYSYRPSVAKKITPKSYYDMGQGLMDLIFDLEKMLDKENKSSRISLRGREKK
ncbi:MAG: NAD-dependent epimerase [Candidatus Marinimicrobia bacterium]|nr:NAD-dependent epimerase [Candidatus Neomarinimicrobiota bacterium]|tara:strand:+ start:57761 stop:58687 length:927 start_codon:yes stop_codon:yes gene_type:complete